MNFYTCKKCKGKGKSRQWNGIKNEWIESQNKCWQCDGETIISLPKVIVEYRKKVQQLSEELKVEHHVDGYDAEESYEHGNKRYNSLIVNEYYDEEPIKEAPTE